MREIQAIKTELAYLQQTHDRAQSRHLMRDNRQIAQIAKIQNRLFELQEENQRLQRRGRGRGCERRN